MHNIQPPEEIRMKPVLVLDMNETLLDVSALDPTFIGTVATTDGPELRKKRFTLALDCFVTATITGEYRSLRSSLRMRSRCSSHASLVESDLMVVVRHTRIDTRQAEATLLSTIAYAQ